MTQKQKDELVKEGYNVLELKLRDAGEVSEYFMKSVATQGRVDEHEFKFAYQIGKKAFIAYRPLTPSV